MKRGHGAPAARWRRLNDRPHMLRPGRYAGRHSAQIDCIGGESWRARLREGQRQCGGGGGGEHGGPAGRQIFANNLCRDPPKGGKGGERPTFAAHMRPPPAKSRPTNVTKASWCLSLSKQRRKHACLLGELLQVAVHIRQGAHRTQCVSRVTRSVPLFVPRKPATIGFRRAVHAYAARSAKIVGIPALRL